MWSGAAYTGRLGPSRLAWFLFTCVHSWNEPVKLTVNNLEHRIWCLLWSLTTTWLFFIAIVMCSHKLFLFSNLRSPNVGDRDEMWANNPLDNRRRRRNKYFHYAIIVENVARRRRERVSSKPPSRIHQHIYRCWRVIISARHSNRS